MPYQLPAGDGCEPLAHVFVANLVVTHHQSGTHVGKLESGRGGEALLPAEIVRGGLLAILTPIQAAVHQLPVNARITFTSILNEDATAPLGVEQAVQQALARRQDLQAQEAQVRAAEATVKAAHAEHMPTASIKGYYGLQGINPDQGRSVFSATANISVPVFEGGRIRADVEQAKAVLDQRRAEAFNVFLGAIMADYKKHNRIQFLRQKAEGLPGS